MNGSFQCQHLGDAKLKATFIYYTQSTKHRKQIWKHKFGIFFIYLLFLYLFFHLYIKEHLTCVVENCVGEEKKKEKH